MANRIKVLLIVLIGFSAALATGVYYGPKPIQPLRTYFGIHPDWSPKTIVPCISGITVSKRAARYTQAELSQNEPQDVHMLSVLRRSHGFFRGRPSAVPDMVICVASVSGRDIRWRGYVPDYQYVSSTGELGRGDEWCKVPEEFRLWVLSLKKAREQGTRKPVSARK